MDDEGRNKQVRESDINSIDGDKVAENPSTLTYGHHVGSAVIKPEDKGRIKGLAVSAMYEQTDLQLNQIKEQIDLLAKQAQDLQDRVRLSEDIYLAEFRFKPLIGRKYHLYAKKDGQHTVSMIGPDEWGKNCPMEFKASVKLLADHTWEILEKAEINI